MSEKKARLLRDGLASDLMPRLGRGTSFMMPLWVPATFVTLPVELPGPMLRHWNIIRPLFLRWVRALVLVMQLFLLPPRMTMTLRFLLKLYA